MGSTTILTALLAVVAAPPPAVVRLEPARPDAACGALVRPCFAPASLSIRNQTRKTMIIDGITLIGPARGDHRPINPPARIEPGATYQSPEVFEVHVEATYRADLSVVSRRGHAGEVVRVALEPALRDAAMARCSRCHPGESSTCACAASDAGQRCTDGTDCQGACVFERYERPDPCPPGLRCGASRPSEVGRCSQWRVPFGCLDVIPSRSPPGGGLSSTYRRCFD